MIDSQIRFGRQYDFYERLADGIVHGVGVVLALIGVTALILHAARSTGTAELLGAAIYGCGLVMTLSVSFAYHMLPHSHLKWQLRKVDHSAIFILIAATYTPFLQKASAHPAASGLMIIIWIMAAAGIVLKCLLPGRYDRLAIVLYILMGWSGLVAFRPITDQVPPLSMLLILAGGIVYTVGVLFHLWERLRFQNAIWHSFVVTAAAMHYIAVLAAI